MPDVTAPAGLPAVTAAAQQPTVTFTSVNAQLATVTASAGLAGASVTSNTFPAQRLGIRVDLLLGGVWTDITAYVYQRNPLQITGMGRADWTATIQPAQLTLTANNRDGRFTPKNTAGAYYPNITRNTQIRLFLSATSTTGATYAGFRFWGEVSEWPPRWDPSGRDVAVDIVASGIWRRISQQQTTIGSAFRRYVDNLTSPAVQAYWPCEDGTGSGQLVPFGSPAGTANALQQFVGGQAGLSLASFSGYPGSDAVVQLNSAMIVAQVPAGGTPTNTVVRCLVAVPAAGDAGGVNWNIAEIHTAGTVRTLELYLVTGGFLKMQGLDSTGSVIFAGTTTTNVQGQPYLVSMELTPGVNFALRIIKAGAPGITESVTGSLGSGSVGAVTQIRINRSFMLQDTAFGHLYVYYGSPTSMVTAATALNGYAGEKALDRFVRICAEQGIPTETIGTSSQSAALGPQDDDTIANIMQDIEDTDCGLLYETKDQFGLGYRTNGSMANQQIQVTLNYTSAVIDESLAPVYDDQLTRNNITITNWTGYAQQAILTTGPMSILNPPNGIGNGYVYTRSVNAASDSQLPGIANFLLNMGSSDEIRFPVIAVRMIRQTLAPFFSSLPNLDIGDYFQITNPPSFLTSTPIRQLVWGYSETLNAKQWDIAFNAVPESPWETGFSPGTIQTAQIPGGAPVSSQSQGSLGLAALVANGSITPAMLSQGITAHTIGGSRVTISFTAPVNPNIGDIWIAADTGLLSTWDGGQWAPILFNADTTIAAGTISSALIEANAIVAGLIAAGAIDGTVINGLQINGVTISGDTITLSGPNDGVFAYGTASGVVQSFTTGSGSWVCPAGVTSVTVEVIGGGGGAASGWDNRGGGGAGGGYALNVWTVTPSTTYFYNVGSGGTGGAAGLTTPASGTAGGSSWFNSSNTLGGTVATGGDKGTAGSSPIALGGTASGTFTASNNGGRGGVDTVHGGGGGGGGGAAGASTNGNSGANTTTESGGAGGAGGSGSPSGGQGGAGGAGGASYQFGRNGSPGTTPGAGGGAGGAGTITNSGGGAGAKGLVRLSYSSGSPQLITSMTGAAGVDPVGGNAVPAGFMGLITAIQPASSPPLAETWHSLGTLAGYSVAIARYRLLPTNEVQIEVSCTAGGANAASVAFANALPSGYRPLADRRRSLAGSMTNTIWPNLFIAAATGVVTLGQNASNGFGMYGDVTFPLD